MHERQVKRWGNMTGFQSIVMVLCVVLVATAAVSIGYAATAPNAATSVVERAATVLDPFALKVVTVESSQPGVKAAALPASFARPATKHPVRIPVRPSLRSPFRPDP